MRSSLRSLLAALAIAGGTYAAPAVAQDAPAAAVTTVLDLGAEPRQLLRYDLGAIQPQSLNMDMTMSMTMSTPFGDMSTPLPTVRSVLSVTGATPTDRGARVNMVIERFEVLPREGVEPMMLQMLQGTLSQMANIAGWMEIDDRGNVLDGGFDYGGADPAIAQQMQSMQDSLRQVAVPLPEEPVGVGARWESTAGVDANGISVTQVASFRVDEISASGVRFTTSVSQTAETQTITDAATGMAMELASLNASGTGTSTLQLNTVVPTATASMSLTMVMRQSGAGGAPMAPMGDMNMSMTIDMSVAPL